MTPEQIDAARALISKRNSVLGWMQYLRDIPPRLAFYHPRTGGSHNPNGTITYEHKTYEESWIDVPMEVAHDICVRLLLDLNRQVAAAGVQEEDFMTAAAQRGYRFTDAAKAAIERAIKEGK